MPDIRGYVEQFGARSFKEEPFNVLDSLVFSQVCYMPFEGLLDVEGASAGLPAAWAFLAARYPDGLTDPFQQKRYLLTRLSAGAPRYQAVLLHDYVNHVDPREVTQFSATAFEMPTGERCIAYRGTDLTIAGWVEDLNMSFMSVPAQTLATAYLERVAAQREGTLYLNGHSKGGHLAMFAASTVAPATQAWLAAVHSFDGQGLDEGTFHGEGYARVAGRIQSYVPQSSLVGLLLCYHPIYTVVRSNGLGLLQHDVLTWQVEGGAFETAPELDWTSRVTHEAIEEWLQKLDHDDRRLLVDTITRVVDAAQADTVDQITANWREKGGRMLAAMRELDAPTKKTVRSFLRMLFTYGANTAVRTILPGLFRTVFGTLSKKEPDEACSLPSAALPHDG